MLDDDVGVGLVLLGPLAVPYGPIFPVLGCEGVGQGVGRRVGMRVVGRGVLVKVGGGVGVSVGIRVGLREGSLVGFRLGLLDGFDVVGPGVICRIGTVNCGGGDGDEVGDSV